VFSKPAFDRSILRRLITGSGFELTSAVFFRLLGLIYLCSFASFWPQIVALVGSHGIAPAAEILTAVRAQGFHVMLQFPTLFLFGISDTALISACVAGCIFAVVMISGYFVRVAAVFAWVLYLSIAVVGQPFSNFQWDALLLEAGFLALFAGVPLTGYAFRFLLFRLMFESGVVKLTSHDPNWRSLHALRFHFLTQPLPDPIAYYVHRLPPSVLDAMTVATFSIELGAPLLLFGPRLVRMIGAGLIAFLQIVIMLTGNYAFFNLLTLALCIWALDDRLLARFVKRGVRLRWPDMRIFASAAVALLIAIGAIELVQMFESPFSRTPNTLITALAPFEIVNTYGLFAVMTTTRPELVIEGSDDLVNWSEYVFPYKPGPVNRRLPIVAPYQPRLDWQMWFAALGSYQGNTWVGGVVYRLLTGDRAVLGLLDKVPFSKPPKFIRILSYDYQFTTLEERSRTGAVWNRTLKGIWFGPVSVSQSGQG